MGSASMIGGWVVPSQSWAVLVGVCGRGWCWGRALRIQLRQVAFQSFLQALESGCEFQ